MRRPVDGNGHPREGRSGVPYVWLLLAAGLTALSALQKLPCLRGRVDTDLLATTQCYSDVPLFYVGRGLAADFGWLGHLPEGYRNLEYPPLINLFIEACGKLTHVLTGTPGTELDRRSTLTDAALYDVPGMAGEERVFFLLTCAGLLLAVLWAVHAAWRAGWTVGDRLSWILAAPITVLTLTVNWDAIALLFTTLALVAWQRRRWGPFGALVALGTATKLFPLVLLAAAFIMLLKVKDIRSVAKMTTVFVVVTCGANAPLFLSNPEAWAEFWHTNTDRPASFGSAWIALRMIGLPIGSDSLSLVLGFGMIGTWALVAALTWRRLIEPTLTELAVVFMLVFFILGKVYSPQYSLWVVLAVLLVTHRRSLVAMLVAAETFHYVATWLYIRGFTTPEIGLDKTYWFSIVVRLAIEGVIVLHILRVARSRASVDAARTFDDLTVAGRRPDPALAGPPCAQ